MVKFNRAKFGHCFHWWDYILLLSFLAIPSIPFCIPLRPNLKSEQLQQSIAIHICLESQILLCWCVSADWSPGRDCDESSILLASSQSRQYHAQPFYTHPFSVLFMNWTLLIFNSTTRPTAIDHSVHWSDVHQLGFVFCLLEAERRLEVWLRRACLLALDKDLAAERVRYPLGKAYCKNSGTLARHSSNDKQKAQEWVWAYKRQKHGQQAINGRVIQVTQYEARASKMWRNKQAWEKD